MASRVAGRRVVLGVCGGIAAYKAVEVCRRLVEAGAHVVPVMTAGATRFVGEVTLSAVASEKVQTSLWDEDDAIPHTRLGQSADAVVVAPATARLLGSYVAGIADDLLTATLLATRAPVLMCPAMHTEMWEHAAVRHNVGVLRARGVSVLDPGVGPLAGGDAGPGRLPDPAAIVAAVESLLAPQDLAGLQVLVTAGGTREPIDAVRFIGNRSSGKQGHALAEEAAARGASVVLVTAASGPVAPMAGRRVAVVRVATAADMETEVLTRAGDCDVVVMAAAVADFRPKVAANGKLAKADGVPDVVLEPTTDILAELGRRRAAGGPSTQFLVGFAAETAGEVADVVARAADKLRGKGVDLVVANDVSAAGRGFDADTNAVVIVAADGTTIDVPLGSKRAVAAAVWDEIVRRLPHNEASLP